MDIKTMLCIGMAVVAAAAIIAAVDYARKYKEEQIWSGRAAKQMSRRQMAYCVNCKHHLKMTKRVGDTDIDTVVCRLNPVCDSFEEKEK